MTTYHRVGALRRRAAVVALSATGLIWGLFPSGASAAPPLKSTPCTVEVNNDLTTLYHSLAAAQAAARPGSTLSVIGTCRGITTITKNLTLRGKTVLRSSAPTVQGPGTGRVLIVESGVTLSLSGLVITGGSNNADGNGSGIFNDGGTVNLNSGAITGNTGNCGGGIYNQLGTVNINGGTISGNTATGGFGSAGDGGGICNELGTVNINGGAIAGNTAGQAGGGIFVESSYTTHGLAVGVVNVNGGSITGNNAGTMGGGIYSGGGSVHLNGGSITGNTAGISGGGVENNSNVPLSGSQTTITGNTPQNVDPPYLSYG